MNKRIQQAIELSISRSSNERVEVSDIEHALSEINQIADDYEHNECDEGEDVYGTMHGCEFRITLVVVE